MIINCAQLLTDLSDSVSLVGKNIEESRSLLSFTPGEVLDDVVFPLYKQGIISDLQ